VLLCYATGPDFVAAFFGCAYAGVIAVPVRPPLSGAMSQRFAAVREVCSARHRAGRAQSLSGSVVLRRTRS
jgi:acyl-CoA synthetase (AMP-forming)/AMP-acid ligase II